MDELFNELHKYIIPDLVDIVVEYYSDIIELNPNSSFEEYVKAMEYYKSIGNYIIK